MSEPTIFIDYFNRSCGEFLIEQKNSLSTYPQYFYIEHISFIAAITIIFCPLFLRLRNWAILAVRYFRLFFDNDVWLTNQDC